MTDLYDMFLAEPVTSQEAQEWATTFEGLEAFMQTERGQEIWHRYQLDTAEDDEIRRAEMRNDDGELLL